MGSWRDGLANTRADCSDPSTEMERRSIAWELNQQMSRATWTHRGEPARFEASEFLAHGEKFSRLWEYVSDSNFRP